VTSGPQGQSERRGLGAFSRVSSTDPKKTPSNQLIQPGSALAKLEPATAPKPTPLRRPRRQPKPTSARGDNRRPLAIVASATVLAAESRESRALGGHSTAGQGAFHRKVNVGCVGFTYCSLGLSAREGTEKCREML
jgi:hypothetical protein